MTRTIPLTQGKVATVDDADFDRVNAFKWYAYKDRNTWYARRSVPSEKAGGRFSAAVLMHRFILGAAKGQPVDHINGDGLDNRRQNIRVCSSKDNARNSKRSLANTSGKKGVHWDAAAGRWRARICVDRKLIYVGSFRDLDAAAAAYDAAAVKYFGQYAKTNSQDAASDASAKSEI
jgi:hypothetical protein